MKNDKFYMKVKTSTSYEDVYQRFYKKFLIFIHFFKTTSAQRPLKELPIFRIFGWYKRLVTQIFVGPPLHSWKEINIFCSLSHKSIFFVSIWLGSGEINYWLRLDSMKWS